MTHIMFLIILQYIITVGCFLKMRILTFDYLKKYHNRVKGTVMSALRKHTGFS